MTDFIPAEDGITHINIYSKGRTALGRFLSNFTQVSLMTEDGPFQSIEGYWFWLGTRNDDLRTLHGLSAKRFGESLEQTVKLTDTQFKDKIREALAIKIRQDKYMAELLKKTVLPLTHYYYYGDVSNPKIVRLPEHDWMVEFMEQMRKELQ